MSYRDAPPRSILLVSTPPALVGIDLDTGRPIWTYDNVPDDGRTLLVEHAGPDDAPCVFFYRTGHLACVHRETGEELWSVATEIGGSAAMIVAPGHVVLAADGFAECWSFRGERLWTRSFSRGRGEGVRRGGRAVETLIALDGVVAHDGH